MILWLIDWLFPKPDHIQKLENLTLEEFHDHSSPPPDTIPDIFSAFYYHSDIVHKALWEFKYNGNKAITKLFAVLLYDIILETISDKKLFYDFSDPILIPLPLSKQRLKDRGWSQTEMLAKALRKIDKNKNFYLNTKILFKIKHTQPQTKLTRAQRLLNLKGCFIVKTMKHVQNRNIILLDDVTTTGSTINEAKRVLMKAGARNVIAFTVAQS